MKNVLSSCLAFATTAVLLSGCGGESQTQQSSSPPASTSPPPSQGLLDPTQNPGAQLKQGEQAPAGEVVTTPSGLQYQDMVVGTGASPVQGQPVTVHYTGWLKSNGTKFDSSVDRGEPFTFPLGVGQVIKGWDEGVSTMKVGGKRRLTIPPNLAYGDQGAGGAIPPGATLVFDVELLNVPQSQQPGYRTDR